MICLDVDLARRWAAAIVAVVSLRPFVPTSELETSLRFFGDLGFATARINDGLAVVELGPFSFLLQKFEAKGFAANFMMQVMVNDLDGWWRRIEALDLAKTYAVKALMAPARQPWGLTVAYVRGRPGRRALALCPEADLAFASWIMIAWRRYAQLALQKEHRLACR